MTGRISDPNTGNLEELVDHNDVCCSVPGMFVKAPGCGRRALEVRALFVDPPSQKGLWNLPAVRAMAQSYAEDAEQVQSMEDDVFQAFGEDVLEEVAGWLDWQPAAPIVFRHLEPDAAQEVFLKIFVEYRRRYVEMLAQTSQPALTADVLEWMVSEEVLLHKIEQPSGPTSSGTSPPRTSASE